MYNAHKDYKYHNNAMIMLQIQPQAPQMARRATASTRRPTSASAGPAGSASGSGGAGGAGAKQHVELRVGLQNVDANRRPTTAGMVRARGRGRTYV
jgi:hypothetical protein